MARALIVQILGDARQFGAELDRAAGKTRQMGRVAGVAGLAIAGGLAYGLEKSVKAAAAAQTTTAKLDAAYQAAGLNAKDYAGGIDKAEASSRNLGFSNIDVRDSLGSLVTATRSSSASVKDLGVAEDIARFKHIGLSDATKTLTTAMAGSQRAAKALGIIVPSVTTNYDRLKASTADLTTHSGHLLEAHAKLLDKMATGQAVIDEVTKRVHGQAQAFADTAAGGMARFHAQSEAIQENLGSALLPAIQAVTSKIADLTSWLSKHNTIAKIAVVVLGALAAILLTVSVYTKLMAAATVIQTAATGAWTAAQWLLNAALSANPIGLVVIALAALTAAIVIAWQHSQTFRNIVTGVFNDFKQAALSVLHWVEQHWPEIATLLSGPFAPLVALATNAFGVRSKLLGALGDMKSGVMGVWDGMKAAWTAAWQGAGAAVKAGIDTIIAAINILIRGIDAIKLPAVGFTIFGHHVGFGGWDGFQIPEIPMLAKGGIVSRPTLAMLGEAGPEAVVPLSHGGGLGGAIHVHVHADTVIGGDMRQVAEDLSYPIRDALARIGRREHGALAGFA